MTSNDCHSLAELADYLLGELDRHDEAALEEHLFSCGGCAERLEGVQRLGVGIRRAVARGGAGGAVNRGFVESIRQAGLRVREYRLEPGQTVPCQAGPEDYVLVRLAARFGELEDLRMEVELQDLEAGVAAPPTSRSVEADREAGEILLMLPGEQVRGYPRSTWTMRVRGQGADGEAELGPFVLDHTP